MENAAEAILIAGGVLLAIVVITSLMFTISTISTVHESDLSVEEAQRLTKWNLEWEAYNIKLLYDTEVLSVINKAKQNNSEYAGNDDYAVTVKLFLANGTEIVNPEEYVKTTVEAKENQIYTCTKMLQNNQTGRIQEIEFKIVK